jgi:hypothetical protein
MLPPYPLASITSGPTRATISSPGLATRMRAPGRFSFLLPPLALPRPKGSAGAGAGLSIA